MNTKIPQNRTGKQEFIAGVLEELPLQLGVAPFGLVFGILGIESGLSPIQTISLSLILFGGASQIVFAQLIAAATPFGIILSSVTMINLRHVLYGLSMASYLRKLPIYWRVLLAYLLTDEAYAVSIRKFMNEPNKEFIHFHLLGSGITLFLSWQLSTLTGIFLGGDLPEFLDLQFIIPLTFIAIIIPMIKSISTLFVVTSSGFTALICKNLDINFWIILSACVGIISGVLTSKMDKKI